MINNKFILLIGIGIGIFFWIAESVMHCSLHHPNRSYFQTIFISSPYEFFMRSCISFLFIVLGIISQYWINKLKNINIALNESRGKYYNLMNTANDAIFIINSKTGMVVEANKKAEALIGIPAHKIVNTHYSQFIPKKDIDFYHRTGGKIKESAVFHKDGHTIPVEVSINSVEYDNNSCIQGIFRDISERLKIQERFRILSLGAEQSHNLVLITNKDGFIEYANPSIEKITGYSQKEVIGQKPSLFKSGKHSDRFYQELWNTILSGKTWYGTLINRKKSGELFYEDTTIAPVLNESGLITHFIALKVNVTARKLIEDTLAETLQYERICVEVLELFNSTYDQGAIFHVILSLLAENNIFPVSAIFLHDKQSDTLNCVEVQGVHKHHDIFFRLEDDLVMQAIRQRKTIITHLKNEILLYTNKNNTVLKITQIVASPILFQDNISGILVVAMSKPINETTLNFIERFCVQLGVAFNNLKQYNTLKTLSEQLQKREQELSEINVTLGHANKMKTEFISNMSHEFRTPLNGIIGFSELMLHEIPGKLSSEQKDYMKHIFSSAERLSSLINNILDISTIEAGKMQLELSSVNIPEIINADVSMLKEKIHAHNINLSVHIEQGIDFIRADAIKLKQIILNLLSNAVKYTPDGGSIIISGKKVHNDSMVFFELSITDTGTGISKENMTRLFKPFEQLDNSPEKNHRGAGLGLVMVKRLTELHNGTVSVESEPGKGSCFKVRIPISAHNSNS
ncbi:MAG: PAS domain-containing sensor histidine kinase [Planctomycetes bacterium]|nr:PAS domain-containing sensor histidine kinase [Planctomycetota bacterium]